MVVHFILILMIISMLLLIALNNYIKVDKHYRRSYYVNNSFYNNIYDNNAQNKYELLCREVGEWEHFENFNNLKKFLILLLTFLFFRFIYSSNVIYINALSSCVKSKYYPLFQDRKLCKTKIYFKKIV